MLPSGMSSVCTSMEPSGMYAGLPMPFFIGQNVIRPEVVEVVFGVDSIVLGLLYVGCMDVLVKLVPLNVPVTTVLSRMTLNLKT